MSGSSGRSNASFLSARSTIFGYVPPGIACATDAASTSAEISSARELHLGHLEALEIDHVAAVLERVVLVGRDVADRHAELEQVRLVALERAQPGLDVERLVRRELLADVAVRHRRARAQQDHHEIEQALAAIAARAGVVALRPARACFDGRVSAGPFLVGTGPF